MASALDVLPDVGEEAADDVVGGAHSRRVLVEQHGGHVLAPGSICAVSQGVVETHVAEAGLDVVAHADGWPDRAPLLALGRLHEPRAVGLDVDQPPVALAGRLQQAVHAAVVDALEELGLDAAGRVGVSQLELRRGNEQPADAAFGGEGQQRVQEHVVPAFEAVLDSRLVLAAAADALDEVRDVRHRPHLLPGDDDVRVRQVPGQAEVLPVPDEIVVEEEIGREISQQRLVGEQHDLPHRGGLANAAHPLRELVPVRAWTRQREDAAREEAPLAVSPGETLRESIRRDLAAADRPVRRHVLRIRATPSPSRTEPRVTALMPVKEFHEAYLRRALASMLGQTSPDWRLLVIVEEQTDELVEALAPALGDERVQLVVNEGRLLAGAINTGMRHARTDYVAILLGDDMWAPEAVAVLTARIERSPDVDFFHSSRVIVDGDDRPISPIYPARESFTLEDFVRASPVKHILCWRRAAGLGIGGLDESSNSVGPDDYDFPWSMAEAGLRFEAVPDGLYV